MGEYAKDRVTGDRIKIGTCEDLLYLRADQLGRIACDGDADPVRHLNVYRFRFPWPDEDRVDPGQFDDPFRSLGVSVKPVDGIDHGTVQFTSNYPHKGYVVSLPCPEDPANTGGPTIHRNGFSGSLRISGQAFRPVDEVGPVRLVTIVECGGCGHKYRATLEHAEEIVAELRERGSDKVADRVLGGYLVCPEAVL